MPDTGLLLAGTAVNTNAGFNDWQYPSRVTVDSTTTTTSSQDAYDESDYLDVTNFGASVPSSATITGVKITYDTKASTNNDISVNLIKLIIEGSVTGNDLAGSVEYWKIGYTDSPFERGGDAELWGLDGGTFPQVTADQLNASTSGVRIQVEDRGGGADIAYVQAVWMTIYYTEAASASSGFFKLMGQLG